MAATTFSGPIRSGTVREGAGQNTGLAVLSQSAAFTQSTTAANTGILVPAGSQILEIAFYVDDAPDTANISAGTSSSANELFTALAAGTTANVILFGSAATIPDITDWLNVGTDDVAIWLDWSAGTSATGTVVVTYVQGANL